MSVEAMARGGALGFWAGVIAAPLAGAGLLALQFQRSLDVSGDSGFAWGITGVLVLSVAPTLLLIFAIISVAGGWSARNARLRASSDWPVLRSTFSTELLWRQLQTGFPGTRRLPYGVTVSAGPSGMALWSGRSSPEMLAFWSWSDVIELHSATAQVVTDRYAALALVVAAPEGATQLTLPLLGSHPFGARPMVPREVARTITALEAFRNGAQMSGAAEGPRFHA